MTSNTLNHEEHYLRGWARVLTRCLLNTNNHLCARALNVTDVHEHGTRTLPGSIRSSQEHVWLLG